MSAPPIPSSYRWPDSPDAVELRAFTHGLQPERVPTMMEHFTEDWRRFGVDAWNEVPNHWRPESDDTVGWWTLPTYLGDHFIAPLLGAPHDTCILQPSVHWTIQCLLSSPEGAAQGTDVVVPETAFPSVLHSVKQWSPLQDLTPQVVASTDTQRVDRTAVLDAIGPDTVLVALSHVGFTTGARLPASFLREVADRVHAHDGLFVLDGYHAAATGPVDVTELECDLYVGGLLKEASGSSGNTFLYLREGLELTPRLTGWFGEGVRLLLDLGLDAVRTHSLRLTDRAIEHADALDLPLRSPRSQDERSAMVLLEGSNAERLVAYLKDHDVYTDSRRNELIRMAPFVWNTRAEVDRAFVQIGTALSTDAHHSVQLDAAGPVT
ncbi:MAG: aminotransferase [Bacteroidetes bacterium SW_11_64_17]|nr:MAG: aminotransferase [Bacteroidetes bacterium SW_11_64_17]